MRGIAAAVTCTLILQGSNKVLYPHKLLSVAYGYPRQTSDKTVSIRNTPSRGILIPRTNNMLSPCHSDNGYRTYITTGRRMNSGDELKPRSHFQLSAFPTCLIYSGLPTGTAVIVLPILVKLPRTQFLRLVQTYFFRQTHHTPACLHPIRSFSPGVWKQFFPRMRAQTQDFRLFSPPLTVQRSHSLYVS